MLFDPLMTRGSPTFLQVGLGRPNRAASSQLKALGKLAAPRRKIVHPHRASLEHAQPIRIPGYSAENHGVFIGVELRLEMIARLSGYKTRWEHQAALGIEGKYHKWDYPTVSIVNKLDRVGVLQVANMGQRGIA